MPIAAAAQAELCRLRRHIARIEGRLAEAERLSLDGPHRRGRAASGEAVEGGSATGPAGIRVRRRRRIAFGIPALDAEIGGGLPLATLHEIRTSESRDGGAMSGFALALIARLQEAGGAGSVLWISEAGSRREAGRLYAPGLAALGLDPASVVEVAATREADALWAFEAALSCCGLGMAVCELRQASLDLSATRRCALRARQAGVTGLLLRLAGPAEPSAAELRLLVAPAPAGETGGFSAGIGRMAWSLALEKNRGGRTGRFMVEWNADERRFVEPARKRHAHPQPFPAAPVDRPLAAGGAGGGLRRAS